MLGIKDVFCVAAWGSSSLKQPSHYRPWVSSSQMRALKGRQITSSPDH